MRGPTKRSLWQILTVVLLAAAAAAVVAINDMTQSPRVAGSSPAPSQSPHVVGEVSDAQDGATGQKAPAWLVTAVGRELTSAGDRNPDSAFWGYARVSDALLLMEEDASAVTDEQAAQHFFWVVLTGDFTLQMAHGPSDQERTGHCLVMSFDPETHVVHDVGLAAEATADPSQIGWMHPLTLSSPGK